MADKFAAIYVRVSSENQSTRSQLPDLERWARAEDGPVRWFTDQESGTTMNRSAWNKLESDMRAGKVSQLVVWRIDRLGRTAAGLTALFEFLKQKRINLLGLQDGVNLKTPAGEMLATVLAGVAQFETRVRSERQRAGIAAAKAAGRTWGGSKPGVRKKVTETQIRMIRQRFAAGEPITAIAAALNLSRPTIYDVLETPAEPAAAQPKKKIEQLREFMAARNWRAALKLAASFPRLGEQKAAIQRGWSAITNPETYRQMRKDPQALIDAGVAALKERYAPQVR